MYFVLVFAKTANQVNIRRHADQLRYSIHTIKSSDTLLPPTATKIAAVVNRGVARCSERGQGRLS